MKYVFIYVYSFYNETEKPSEPLLGLIMMSH
jgi:hypothetical protein